MEAIVAWLQSPEDVSLLLDAAGLLTATLRASEQPQAASWPCACCGAANASGNGVCVRCGTRAAEAVASLTYSA
jgi:hypothetical protein